MQSTPFTQDVQRRPNLNGCLADAREAVSAVRRHLQPVNIEALSSSAFPTPPKAPPEAQSVGLPSTLTAPRRDIHPNGLLAFALVEDDFLVTPLRVNGKEPFLPGWQKH